MSVVFVPSFAKMLKSKTKSSSPSQPSEYSALSLLNLSLPKHQLIVVCSPSISTLPIKIAKVNDEKISMAKS